MPLRTNLKSLEPSRERLKKVVTLLSKGYSAPELFPGGALTIYPWDTEVSSWLASNRSISQGRILYTLAARLTGLREEQVTKFVAGEVILVLLVARALASDQRLSYSAKCPHCGTIERASVLVPDELEKIGEKAPDYPGYDEILLPDAGDTLRVRPLLVSDEISIAEAVPEKMLNISDTGARLLTGLVSVNGTIPDDLPERVRYYQALSPSDVQFFVDEVDRLTPHLNTERKHKCSNPKCAQTFSHELALDEEFFRPSRRAGH